jgi:hypothetical protein
VGTRRIISSFAIGSLLVIGALGTLVYFGLHYDPERVVVDFNWYECGFWELCAIVLAIKSRAQSGRVRSNLIMAAVAFVFFGFSDGLETLTGAWWRPLELFLLKATCVLVFLICLWRHKQCAAKSASDSGNQIQDLKSKI